MSSAGRSARPKQVITGAQLSIGAITVRERRAMLVPAIGVAWAEDEDAAIVLDQRPAAGTEVSPGDAVDLTAEFSMAVPEPGSLALFATGLAFIVLVLMRRRV
jgi:hypothetical protein